MICAQRGTATTTSEVPTARELEVLRNAACGYSNKEIASVLGISAKTVEAHKSSGMRKLGLVGRRELLHYARLQGWLTDV
jgi:DNA-binding NarL/FixJ family response regulator